MASSAVHIPNMKTAIESGQIPGTFNDDRTMFKFNTLAYSSSRGSAIHYWIISVQLIHNNDYVAITAAMLDNPVAKLVGYKAEIMVNSHQANGKVRDVIPTYVSDGKNIGKVNETNCITQAIRNALGLYNKQMKRVNIILDSKVHANAEAPTNSKQSESKYPPPMLVKKIGDSVNSTLMDSDFKSGITVQTKLNGVRYVAFKSESRVICYSRTGLEYPGQVQVVQEITTMFNNYLPTLAVGKYGITDETIQLYMTDSPHIDGELYIHNKSLNWISGQARRGDDDGNLQWHIFDVFFPNAIQGAHNMASKHRQEYIDDMFANAARGNHQHPHIVRVKNYKAANLTEVENLAKQFLNENYEGAIARKDTEGYMFSYNGYHSANVLKIKPKFDAEFKVIGMDQGTRGKEVGAILWICEVPNPIVADDNTFTVVPKDMTYETRYELFRCLSQIGDDGKTKFETLVKGLPLTVEYAELSAKTGKPLQAKALIFRTYENGSANDPIAQILLACKQ